MSEPGQPAADSTGSNSERLAELRGQIDRLDQSLLDLLSERGRLARAVGLVKKGQMYRPEREAQVLRGIKARNPGPLSDETVAKLFREIMSACLAVERPITVAYLGPAGTFTEQAAVKHFGLEADVLPTPTIDEVYRAVESGSADFGVVPVENSTEGAVGRSLDLMPNTPLRVCGEVLVRIHQNFMQKDPSVPMQDILRVYSHGQSLAQCHEWLNQNVPKADRIQVSSNAEAARRAADEPTSAAVAGLSAAQHYGLTVMVPNIEDEPNNTTRFLVMGDYEPAPSGHDKTSLVLSARNVAGAVYQMLTPFARRGVSMTRFESRPSKAALWEYLFFVDIEGHRSDANVAAALEELEGIAGYLKVLGSYPVAVI